MASEAAPYLSRRELCAQPWLIAPCRCHSWRTWLPGVLHTLPWTWRYTAPNLTEHERPAWQSWRWITQLFSIYFSEGLVLCKNQSHKKNPASSHSWSIAIWDCWGCKTPVNEADHSDSSSYALLGGIIYKGFLGTLNPNIMFIYLPRSAVLWGASHLLGKGESPSPEEHKIRTAAHGNTHPCLEGKI